MAAHRRFKPSNQAPKRAKKNPAEAGLFYFMAPRYFFFIASAALAAGVEVGAARGGHKPTSR